MSAVLEASLSSGLCPRSVPPAIFLLSHAQLPATQRAQGRVRWDRKLRVPSLSGASALGSWACSAPSSTCLPAPNTHTPLGPAPPTPPAQPPRGPGLGLQPTLGPLGRWPGVSIPSLSSRDPWRKPGYAGLGAGSLGGGGQPGKLSRTGMLPPARRCLV